MGSDRDIDALYIKCEVLEERVKALEGQVKTLEGAAGGIPPRREVTLPIPPPLWWRYWGGEPGPNVVPRYEVPKTTG